MIKSTSVSGMSSHVVSMYVVVHFADEPQTPLQKVRVAGYGKSSIHPQFCLPGEGGASLQRERSCGRELRQPLQ